MLYRMTKDEECKIAYEEILQFIDRTICPPPDELPINVKVFFFIWFMEKIYNFWIFRMNYGGVLSHIQKLVVS